MLKAARAGRINFGLTNYRGRDPEADEQNEAWEAIRQEHGYNLETSKDVRKILLGREFVEGTWLDLLSHGDTQIAYGVTRIVSSESSLRITGLDYDLNAEHTGYYSVDMLMFEFPKIKYKYTYQKSDNQGLAQEGFGEIQFTERNGPPSKYAGFSFNLMEGRRVTFASWKGSRAKKFWHCLITLIQIRKLFWIS